MGGVRHGSSFVGHRLCRVVRQRRIRVNPPGATVTGTVRAATDVRRSRVPASVVRPDRRLPAAGNGDALVAGGGGGAAQQGGAVPGSAEHQPGDERLDHQRVEPGLAHRSWSPSPYGRRRGSVVGRVTGSSAPGAGESPCGPTAPDRTAPSRSAAGREGGDAGAARLQVDHRHQQRGRVRAEGEPGGAAVTQGRVAGAAELRLPGPQRRRGRRRSRRRTACRPRPGRPTGRPASARWRVCAIRADRRVGVEREHRQQPVDRRLGAGVLVDRAVGGDPVEGDAGGRVVGRGVRGVGAEEPGGRRRRRAASPGRAPPVAISDCTRESAP